MQLDKVGLIGLGSMGKHYARRLLEHGHALVIHDINRDALEPFSREDVVLAASPKEVADLADIVLVSLPTPRIVREVALGGDGIVNGSKVKVYIDLSTTGQKTAVEVAGPLNRRGIAVLDAPVSGGVKGAQTGSLTVIISGDHDTYVRVKPILDIIGRNHFYIGDRAGQAQVMKLANNMLSAAAMVITSEVVLLGMKAGLDPEKMLSVINVSSGRSSASLDKFPQYILNGRYDYGFKTSLMYKDVLLCMEMADELNHPMWMGSCVMQYWKYAFGLAEENEDFTKIFEHVKKLTGSTV